MTRTKRRQNHRHYSESAVSSRTKRCRQKVASKAQRGVDSCFSSSSTCPFLLECLNDDLLLEIASFLVLVCPSNNRESSLEVNVLRRCWGVYGSLSKDFQRRTRMLFDYDVEADFYGVDLRNYYSTFLFLTNNEMRLSKLRIYTESHSTNYVAMLCQKCDTSKLKKVEVKVTRERFSRFESGQINDGSVATRFTATESKSSQEARPMSIHELHKEIATHCPSLQELKINAWAQHSQRSYFPKEEHAGMSHKNVDLGGALSRKLRNLRRLEISVGGRSREAIKLLRAFLRLAENIQGLHTLILSTGDFPGYETFGERVRIQSKSLRVIDVTGFAKGLWITKCFCPSLERFICTGGAYGNGVRTCKPPRHNSRKTYYEIGSGTFQAGSTKFYGLSVPGSCVVDLL